MVEAKAGRNCPDCHDGRPHNYGPSRLFSMAAILSTLLVSHVGLSGISVVAWHFAQWPIALFFVMVSLWLCCITGVRTPSNNGNGSRPVQSLEFWYGSALPCSSACTCISLIATARLMDRSGGVIVLLLWLYIAGMALLLGGEINSEIENAAAKRGHPEAKDEGEKVA